MSYYYHADRKLYSDHQYLNSKEHIIPFVEKTFPIKENMQILEIGCGEGGILRAFLEKGCYCTGVDLTAGKIEIANELFKQEIADGRIKFINKNIYDVDFKNEFQGKFDLVILKDAIEHIHEQAKIIDFLKIFLRENGKIFIGMPPWYNPMGGHQQICKSKYLDKTPWIHLLPKPLYKGLLKALGEEKVTIDWLMETKDLGISIERFERILKKTGYKIIGKTFFLVNPKYKYKFNVKPKEQFRIISAIPYVRDFFTTTAYYLFEPIK